MLMIMFFFFFFFFKSNFCCASYFLKHYRLLLQYYINTHFKEVNRPFKDFIFPSPCSRVNGLFGHIKFVVLFLGYFFLGRLSLLSCIFTCNPTFYDLKNIKLTFFFIQHLSKRTQ